MIIATRKQRRLQTRSQKQKIKSSYATITDLPNEIIVIVLDQLAEPDLYALSFLCRRLHVLALPLYLKKRDISTSDGAVTVSTRSHDDFKAIRSALFVHTLTRLDCHLFPGELEHTRHLERLICRMSNVLDVNFFLCSAGSEGVRSLNPLPTFLKALERKSCHTLSVTTNGSTDAFITRQKVKLLPITTLTRCRIVGSGHVLLRPPWLKWTVESLNGSPLAHLEFVRCTDELAKALPSFSLPRLVRLAVHECHLTASVLAEFLSRHPTILTLKVSSLQQDVPVKLKLFPSLTSVYCDALTLDYLLAKSRAFPCLRAIYVSDLMIWDIMFITKIFKAIARTRISYLWTPLRLSEPQKTWLRSLRQPSRRRALATMQLYFITTVSTYHHDIHDLMAVLSLWSPIFPSLKQLNVKSTSDAFFAQWRDDKLALMEDLVEMYPQIQVVVVNGVGGTLEDWRCGKERIFGSPCSNRSLTWCLQF